MGSLAPSQSGMYVLHEFTCRLLGAVSGAVLSALSGAVSSAALYASLALP